jgi:SAM-dependent methyltransferase
MRSFDRPESPESAPSRWVTRHAHLIPAGGTVLDVACGHGRHARWLVARGFRVVAVDIDVTDLADLRDDPRVETVRADLEAAPWPFAEASFAAVVVTNYLHRPLFGPVAAAIAPGGVLLWETFGAGNERLGRPRNPAFLLEPGELLRAFDGVLDIVAYEHGLEHDPRPAVRQRLCARRGAEPVPLAP